jgi:hypothetical protein
MGRLFGSPIRTEVASRELPEITRTREGEKMKQYEKPALVAAGSFRKSTGLLQRNGNDRLILSKN